MTPQEIRAVRTSWLNRSEKVRVPPYNPSPLCTPSFHEFLEDMFSSWLPEPAKLLYTSTFHNCPFSRSMTEQEETFIRHKLVQTTADELSVPGLNARSDVLAADLTQALPLFLPYLLILLVRILGQKTKEKLIWKSMTKKRVMRTKMKCHFNGNKDLQISIRSLEMVYSYFLALFNFGMESSFASS
ncbi:hypothetical protein L3X38_025912 [Prunus dulcis]|uniref:Uncharacterized protein n=1 Tax=Prunus dulcis TaxID=3755 RepID=A0AAD4W2S7_PRUDU|nr:hypothetical protein L3X38_025912 [Prunus dulcis]